MEHMHPWRHMFLRPWVQVWHRSIVLHEEFLYTNGHDMLVTKFNLFDCANGLYRIHLWRTTLFRSREVWEIASPKYVDSFAHLEFILDASGGFILFDVPRLPCIRDRSCKETTCIWVCSRLLSCIKLNFCVWVHRLYWFSNPRNLVGPGNFRKQQRNLTHKLGNNSFNDCSIIHAIFHGWITTMASLKWKARRGH